MRNITQPGQDEILIEIGGEGDEDTGGSCTYPTAWMKILIGHYGPYVEFYLSDPRVPINGELPWFDNQIELQYYNGNVQLNWWNQGQHALAESDDIDCVGQIMLVEGPPNE